MALNTESIAATQANSASYPLWNGKWVPAEIRLAEHITRSHYWAYTINFFVFLKETNAGSGTSRNEATERSGSLRKSSKPKRKGWVGQTVSEFAVGFTRTTASDSLSPVHASDNVAKNRDIVSETRDNVVCLQPRRHATPTGFCIFLGWVQKYESGDGSIQWRPRAEPL